MGKRKRSSRLRPTSSMVKKALFDILGEDIKDRVFLDLYAGTGNVGMEALKRGARYTVFVEVSKRDSESIKKRLIEYGLDKKGEVITRDVSKFLKDIPSGDMKFDIVFADPPYETDEYEKLSELLPEFKGLSDDAIIILEHFHKMSLPEKIGIFVLLKRYRYGDTILSMYRRQV